MDNRTLVCDCTECRGTHTLNAKGEICAVERANIPPVGQHVRSVSSEYCLAGSGIIITRCATPGCRRIASIAGRPDDTRPYPLKIANNITLANGQVKKGTARCTRCQTIFSAVATAWQLPRGLLSHLRGRKLHEQSNAPSHQ